MKILAKLSIALKTLRTRVRHWVRGKLGLVKQDARDSLINGSRRDIEAIAQYAVNLAAQIEALNDRLSWYEHRVPLIAVERRKYEAAVAKRKAKAEAPAPPESEAPPQMAVVA